MFPKEHGAYGQLAFPLVTSFALAGVTTPALLLGLTLVAGFLAHEPLLVLLGGRGRRAQRQNGLRAIAWLALTGATTSAAAIAALWMVPATIRWSFAIPVLPMSLLTMALLGKQEKSALGETAAAMTFSFAAIPVCLAAGAPSSTATSVGVVFAAIFVTGTLAVRLVVLRARAGGNPRAVRTTRVLLLITATGAAGGMVAAAIHATLSWTTLLAAAPGLLLAISLAILPVAPARLRLIGWLLVSTSAAAAIVLTALTD
jgi:hypothetical protein